MHRANISLFWYKSIRISTYVLNLTGSLDPWIPLVIHEKVEFHASCTNITLLIQIYKNLYLCLEFDWILGSLNPNSTRWKGLILCIKHKYPTFAHIYVNWYLCLKVDWILRSLDPTSTPWKGLILHIMHKCQSFETNL